MEGSGDRHYGPVLSSNLPVVCLFMREPDLMLPRNPRILTSNYTFTQHIPPGTFEALAILCTMVSQSQKDMPRATAFTGASAKECPRFVLQGLPAQAMSDSASIRRGTEPDADSGNVFGYLRLDSFMWESVQAFHTLRSSVRGTAVRSVRIACRRLSKLLLRFCLFLVARCAP